MAEDKGKKTICDCWDNIIRLTVAVGKLNRNLGDKDWREIRKNSLPRVKEFIESLENCSGTRLDGVRSRVSSIEETYLPRYDWASMLGAGGGIEAELVYDIGCRKKPKK